MCPTLVLQCIFFTLQPSKVKISLFQGFVLPTHFQKQVGWGTWLLLLDLWQCSIWWPSVVDFWRAPTELWGWWVQAPPTPHPTSSVTQAPTRKHWKRHISPYSLFNIDHNSWIIALTGNRSVSRYFDKKHNKNPNKCLKIQKQFKVVWLAWKCSINSEEIASMPKRGMERERLTFERVQMVHNQDAPLASPCPALS